MCHGVVLLLLIMYIYIYMMPIFAKYSLKLTFLQSTFCKNCVIFFVYLSVYYA